MRHHPLKVPVGILSLVLAASCLGCAATDPYQRAGMWQPSGAVQANLAAMVADPGDLVIGHGDGQAAQYQTTGAVDRLWADQTKPLLNGGAAPATGQATAQPQAGAGSQAVAQPSSGGN